MDNAFPGSKALGRWVVRNAEGGIFVSEETFETGKDVVSGSLQLTGWARLDTSGSDYYKKYPEFTPLALVELTGAGVYFEAERTNVTGKSNAGTGFRLNKFRLDVGKP